ncbi:MAG: energy-coupled thiamine transporter ThiT [Firmicutes bacterium]|nr:energy-coupled thiamine transporter ThiT [Bacillota bacterium]
MGGKEDEPTTGAKRATGAGDGAIRAGDIAEIGVAVALALVLQFVKVLKMPQGGSVSLEMVPTLYLALRRGPKAGVIGGALLGFGKLLVEPYIIHPVQLIMDYPLPFAAIGLAGFFRKRPLVGTALGSIARFLIHFLSGVIFFASYAPEGQSPVVYSAVYNASYIIPELIISAIVIEALMRSGRLFGGRKGAGGRVQPGI